MEVEELFANLEIAEGAVGIMQTLLDKSYADNAKLNNRIAELETKLRNEKWKTESAQRKYNELTDLLRFRYEEDE